MRRALIIIGTIAVLIAMTLVVYFLFFTGRNEGVTATPGNQFPEADSFEGEGSAPEIGESQEVGEEITPYLVKITDGPVASGIFVHTSEHQVAVNSLQGTSTASSSETIVETKVRYVERASGNVYSYDSGTRTVTRLSNRTLPGIREAIWTGDGSYAFLRFLSEDEEGSLRAETYALPVEHPEDGYFLEVGLDGVLASGTSTVVTLLPNSSGSIATAAQANGTAPKTLFTSLLSSLRLLPTKNGFAAYTKASNEFEGYGFLVSSAGAFERILGPLRALTLLPSPSGAFVLYSSLSGNTIKASLLDTKTRTSTALPVAALPEKCAFAHDESAIYCAIPRTLGNGWPDLWYQGATSYSDRIWEIDLEAQVAALVIDPVAVAETAMDAVSLTLDPADDYLVFVNKKDGSLWMYDL